MIAREVGKHSGRKLQARHTILVQRVRRRFHCHLAHSTINERTQYTLQLHGTGCREAAASIEFVASTPDEHTERANGSRAMTRFIEQVSQHADGSGLSVGARDTDELQLVRGLAVKCGSRNGRRAARISHDNGRQRGACRIVNDCDARAIARCNIQVVVAIAVCPAHRKEECTRCDGAAVIGDGTYTVW